MGKRITVCLALLVALPALTAADRRPVVTVSRPLERETTAFDFVGRLGPAEARELRTQVDGVVEKVAVHNNNEVKAGEDLFVLDARPFQEALARAEEAVKQREAELKHRKDLLDRARELARSLKTDELKKRADAKLPGLQSLLEKDLKLVDAAAKKDPFELRQAGLEKLREAIDRQLRLVRTRKKEGCDLLFEEELGRLRQAIAVMLRLPAAGGDQEAHKTFVAELRILDRAIADLLVLSRARSERGIDILAAERDVTARLLDNEKALVEKAKDDAGQARIVAPAAGRITGVGVKPGDRVTPATRLAVLARTDTVRIAFDVNERTMLLLQKLIRDGKFKETRDVPVRLGLESEDGFPHRGELDFIDSRVGDKDHLVHVVATIANADGVLTKEALAERKKPAVRVRLTLGDRRRVLLVPGAAVGTDADGKSFVLVVNNKNVVESRTVKLGSLSDGLQVIEDGLHRDDWVILGSERIKRGPSEQTLMPEDFARDLHLLSVRPGTVVEPARMTMPTPKKPSRPKRE